MSAEISPEITAAVISDGPIGPQVQQTIVTAAMNAQKEREKFVGTLNAKMSALSSAYDTLSEIQETILSIKNKQWQKHSFDEIYTICQKFGQRQSECEKVLQERQAQRQTGHARIQRDSVPDLQTYLYQKEISKYTVINDTLYLYDNIRMECRRIAWWITTCD